MSEIKRCVDCGTPIAKVHDDGTVEILSRHHGERHVNLFKVSPPKVDTGARQRSY